MAKVFDIYWLTHIMGSMSKRKTISIAKLRDTANTILSADTDRLELLKDMTPQQAYRMGAAIMLEMALHETDNYEGYSFLPGIVNYEVSPPEISDDSRRVYK